MAFVPKEEKRRQLPTEELQDKLKPIIGNILPYEATLERIITEWGFRTPGYDDFDGEIYYGFCETIDGITYTKLYMDYVDALAEEILFIIENKLR